MNNARQTRIPVRIVSTLVGQDRSAIGESRPDGTNAFYASLPCWPRHVERWMEKVPSTRVLLLACTVLIVGYSAAVSFAQPVPLSPPQLDQLVARIALYPDPLLANILLPRPTRTRFLKPRHGQMSTAI